MVVRSRMARANRTVRHMESKVVLLESLADREAKAVDEVAKTVGR